MAADVIVLTFPDLNAFGGLSSGVFEDLGPVFPGAVAVIDWRTCTPDELSPLLQRGRLICVGIGAGGRAAILFGKALKAESVLAWAPGDGAEATAAHEAADTWTPRTCIISSPDTIEADAVLSESLGLADVQLESTTVARAALSVALRSTCLLHRPVAALIDNADLAAPDDLLDAWHEAFAHELECNLSDAYSDAVGAVQVPALFHNRSDRVMNLKALLEDRVLAGARLFDQADRRLDEARSLFAKPVVFPGEAVPLKFRLSPEAGDLCARIEVALVCERRFWFDDLSFSHASSSLDQAQPSILPVS